MKKVLLAEDTDIWIKTYKRLLIKQFGFSVVVAKNGKDAINFINNETFDLVVCDHYMPGQTGNAVYAHIRKSDESKNKNVVFIHHSSMPCSYEYAESDDDKNFYIIPKDGDVHLITSLLEELGFGD